DTVGPGRARLCRSIDGAPRPGAGPRTAGAHRRGGLAHESRLGAVQPRRPPDLARRPHRRPARLRPPPDNICQPALNPRIISVDGISRRPSPCYAARHITSDRVSGGVMAVPSRTVVAAGVVASATGALALPGWRVGLGWLVVSLALTSVGLAARSAR